MRANGRKTVYWTKWRLTSQRRERRRSDRMPMPLSDRMQRQLQKLKPMPLDGQAGPDRRWKRLLRLHAWLQQCLPRIDSHRRLNLRPQPSLRLLRQMPAHELTLHRRKMRRRQKMKKPQPSHALLVFEGWKRRLYRKIQDVYPTGCSVVLIGHWQRIWLWDRKFGIFG